MRRQRSLLLSWAIFKICGFSRFVELLKACIVCACVYVGISSPSGTLIFFNYNSDTWLNIRPRIARHKSKEYR